MMEVENSKKGAKGKDFPFFKAISTIRHNKLVKKVNKNKSNHR